MFFLFSLFSLFFLFSQCREKLRAIALKFCQF